MQTRKNTTTSVKDSVQNVAASAKSGLDKTKAVVQEKVEKMMAHSMEEKEMAREKKEEKIREAELNKQHTREMNAAEREVERTRAVAGRPHRTSAAPYNEVTEVPQGAAAVSPIDRGTVTPTEFNPVCDSTTQTRYEPGADYSRAFMHCGENGHYL